MDTIETLDTEQINTASSQISEVSTLERLTIINNEDKRVAQAVSLCLPKIAEFVDHAAMCLKQQGRLFYIGAGTSGRLGVLDASECPPTYGVKKELVQGIIAGGTLALTDAVEGCEDDEQQAVEDLKQAGFTKNDCLLGIAASGRTPYVVAALRHAKAIGAYTGALSCCHKANISACAETAIEVITGAEVVSGSTRMKAGTAQKMVLNMISTSLMIALGKVYKNYMVDVMPTNEKLVQRAKRLIKLTCDCDDSCVEQLFEASHHSVKTAIVMHKLKLSYEEAEKRLKINDNLNELLSDK